MLRFTRLPVQVSQRTMRRFYADDGAIKKAGDTFAKKEAAMEDQYIRQHDAEKLKHLKEELKHQNENADAQKHGSVGKDGSK